MTDEELRMRLRAMPWDWAQRWCVAKYCACLGCANHHSDGLARLGVTREQWERALNWIKTEDAAHAGGMISFGPEESA